MPLGDYRGISANCVEPMHFGCFELVEQHGCRQARHDKLYWLDTSTCRVVSRRDVMSQVEFGLYNGMTAFLFIMYIRFSV